MKGCFPFLCVAMSAIACLAEARTVVVEERSGAAIQTAIDSLSATGGGRVILKAGVYPSKSLRLRSHVELYLEKDAVIHGSGEPLDYTPSEDALARAGFLQAYDEQNFAIAGQGRIEIEGAAFFDTSKADLWGACYHPWEGPRPEMLQLLRCRNVRLEGVSFVDAPLWTMRIKACECLCIENVTIRSDRRFINSDGIDIDSCRHVIIRGCDISSCDDAISVRAIPEPGSDKPAITEDLWVEDCKLASSCSIIRIGCPSDDTIRNVVFRNIRGGGANGIRFDYPLIYLSEHDEGRINVRDILFENITGSFADQTLLVNVAPGIAIRGVRDVVFRNVNLKGRHEPTFVGNSRSKIEHMRRENFVFNGTRLPDGEFFADCSNGEPLKIVKRPRTHITRPRPDGRKFANPNRSF